MTGGIADAAARLGLALADRYRIERELGAGGMATVYLAHDLKHDRKVALKVLHPDLAATIGVDRFLSEIKVTANLQHPNILGLFDSGVADGQAYYVMPYVDGESLRDRLARETQLPVADTLSIATGIAAALEYAHARGVIHRDIKPENILLQSGQPIVADFGIALAVQQAGGQRLTQTGMSLGTPQYMSPEQAMGDRTLDARTDIYALGAITYEMLAGEAPFTGPNTQAIVARVLTEKPRPLSQLRETVPAQVEAAVHRALQKLPADRFANAAAFASVLASSTLGDLDAATRTRAASKSTGERTRTESGRLLAMLGGAVALAIITLFVGRAWGRTDAPPATAYSLRRLGGPNIAMLPRLSPDGKTFAFAGLIGHQSQIGILNAASGDWRIVTHDTTRGLAESPVWAPDGSRIFYDRLADVPRGIFTVSATGESDERLILPNACSPYPLSDGSLLALRLNGDRRLQMLRYYPQSGRIDTLPAFSSPECNATGTLIDVLPGEREAVFIGGVGGTRDTLYAVDLTTHKVRALWSGISGARANFRTAPDGRSVVVSLQESDEYRVVGVATSGSGRTTELFASTSSINGIDVGADGTIYADQVLRPYTAIIYDLATGRTERIPQPPGGSTVIPLRDGRLLRAATAGGTSRIVAESPGRDPVEFLASGEPSTFPVAALGDDRVMIRTTGSQGVGLTIAHAATGRIAGRIAGFDHKVIAGSPDGTTIYYADAGSIWAMPSAGGAARKLHDGDSMAPTPDGKYLIIQLNGVGSCRLVRFSLDGGADQEIAVHSPLPIATNLLLPNAVGPDGRILVEAGSPGSWFWPPAILDPKTGSLTIVLPNEEYDGYAGWSSDGRVVMTTQRLQSMLWRFRPVGPGAQRP
jgi:serine/threonine protein kinase